MEKTYCSLVTGACGGLGREFVKLLAAQKENLILVGTSEKKLEQLKIDLAQELDGVFVKTFVCNLAKLEDIDALVNNITKENLIVKKLINNAGVIIEGDIMRFSDDEIANAIAVNCTGTLLLTKKLVERRDETKKFEILTVSSQAAFQPIPHMALYAATKSFLASMMTALKVEWKDQNIVVTTICPSGMATTKDMQESIKSMGFGGKITTLPAKKVAKKSLVALKKRKAIVIPGAANKFINVLSKPFSKYFLAKTTGRIWRKSQKKRNF